jgi:asparagine synthase (glutamine-hydrolysing)
MTDAIAHRGPEGEGHWTDANGRVALGHRRLAVIDLTETARQPMHYGDGRYIITFNGEIYNYVELKEVLRSKGYRFETRSDTEVLMAMYDWKKEKALDYLDGMFAFAIYDTKENVLFCARDRFGEKPFYYAFEPGKFFIFGSEMKALWAAGLSKTVNAALLYNYLAYGLLQNVNDRGETFYRDIFTLENSHYIRLDTGNIRVEKTRYWDIEPRPGKMQSGKPLVREEAAMEEFRELLNGSIRRRLRSDVPVGSSLSGGLDSSLIVCQASGLLKEKNRRLQTFSARFPSFAKDEGTYMQMAVERAQADPFYVYPSGDDLARKIKEAYYYQEEPFGSASILAQYDLMRAAGERGVTVLLDGQGADEILGGYRHYYPPYIRELRAQGWRQGLSAARDYLGKETGNHVNFGLIKGIGHIICNDFPSLLRSFKTGRVAANQVFAPLFNKDFYEVCHHRSYLPGPAFDRRVEGLGEMLYYDAYQGGLSELLRYADRNAMAHSREIRLPFLDHELVKFLFQLPADLKIRRGWTKYIMRKAFESELPQEIAWRRDKIGYEPPQREWMNTREMEEAVGSAVVVLVEQGILHKGWLDRHKGGAGKEPGREDVHPGRDMDWRFLMAAGLFG